MEIFMNLKELALEIKTASKSIRLASTVSKNQALANIGQALIKDTQKIIEANKKDLENGRKNGLTEALLDRLMLNEDRISGIANALNELIALDDPCNKCESGTVRPNGLRIFKTKVPLGVIGIIYESRPNVTVDAAALCLKSGNAVLLRGGKEAVNTNKTLVDIMKPAIKSAGICPDVLGFIEDTDRALVNEMITLNGLLDLVIPRGSGSLINAVVTGATVPVIETGTGNCHIFVNRDADIEMAVDICENAKASRPSVCNAAETFLIHKDIAKEILPEIKKALDKYDTKFYGCGETVKILGEIEKATEEDYFKEYLDFAVAVKVVKDVDEAVSHIEKYSSGHSEAIITNSIKDYDTFKNGVDAAAVYLNASTRFTDGGEFGLGAEIGISTGKMHCRGPLGLEDLTTTKFIIEGSGQTR